MIGPTTGDVDVSPDDSISQKAIQLLVLLEALEVSGPAKLILHALSGLRNRVTASIVAYLRRGQATSPVIQCSRDMGFDVHVLREQFRYDPRAIGQLRRLIQSVQPDLLEIHNTKSRLYAMLLRLTPAIGRIPQIHVFHGETWMNAKQRLYNRLDRQLLKRSRHVVVVSSAQTPLLASWGVRPERITVIPNAIALRPGHPKPVSDRPTILCVGRLSSEKGQMLLVQAAGDLVEAGQRNFRLVLVGDGPTRDEIAQYVKQHNLQDWITLAGYQADTDPYYHQADLFVLPSYTEGFPTVLLEAAMHYVPMMAFPVGGIADAFADGHEIALVPGPDRHALARQLQDFLQSPARYQDMALQARRRVEQEHSLENKAQRLLRYYHSLLA